MAKKHLSSIVIEHYPNLNPKQINGLIMAGNVFVNQQKVTKPGYLVKLTDKIEVRLSQQQYVSRAGNKIAGIWQEIGISLNHRIAIDAGISTGGFTDFLLQQGIEGVIGIDVAYGVTDYQIRNHSKVALVERTNVRHVSRLELERHSHRHKWNTEWLNRIQLVVMDVSFIHAKKCIDPLLQLVQKPCDFIVLVKPQFEATKDEVGEGGIVRDPIVHRRILDRTKQGFEDLGLVCHKEIPAAITGTKGNQEVFFWLIYS